MTIQSVRSANLIIGYQKIRKDAFRNDQHKIMKYYFLIVMNQYRSFKKSGFDFIDEKK